MAFKLRHPGGRAPHADADAMADGAGTPGTRGHQVGGKPRNGSSKEAGRSQEGRPQEGDCEEGDPQESPPPEGVAVQGSIFPSWKVAGPRPARAGRGFLILEAFASLPAAGSPGDPPAPQRGLPRWRASRSRIARGSCRTASTWSRWPRSAP